MKEEYVKCKDCGKKLKIMIPEYHYELNQNSTCKGKCDVDSIPDYEKMKRQESESQDGVSNFKSLIQKIDEDTEKKIEELDKKQKKQKVEYKQEYWYPDMEF